MDAVGSSKKTIFGRPIKVKTKEKRRFDRLIIFLPTVLFVAGQTAIVDQFPDCSKDLIDTLKENQLFDF